MSRYSEIEKGKRYCYLGGLLSILIAPFLIFIYSEYIFLIPIVIVIQVIMIVGGAISLLGIILYNKNEEKGLKIIKIGAYIGGGLILVLMGYKLLTMSETSEYSYKNISIPDLPEGKPLLEIKKVYHYYGKAKSLEELNLKINKGEITAVIGPNGAGKSTLLRNISGLEEPDRGKIMYMGRRIDGMKPFKIAKLGIAHCPERRRLFYDMSVYDNLMMGAYTLKDKNKIRKQLNFVYDIFPRLKERRKQRSGTLSGGEQQMLALGRSIMSNPILLLLDEPSLGLAPKIKNEIFDAIREIKKTGTTTLIVEQDAVLAIKNSDYIHVLEEGKIEMRGTREELEKEPRIKKTYLGI